MPVMLCCQKDCPVHREIDVTPGVVFPTWYCKEHRGETEFQAKRGSDTYRDCAFCKDVIAYGVAQRHSDGHLFHIDCLIQMLKNQINDLKNPLTGEVQDDSIPNAFKKLRSALRDRARIYNKFINEHHGRLTIYTPGIYKTRVIRVWNQALEIADLNVRNAIKELEKYV